MVCLLKRHPADAGVEHLGRLCIKNATDASSLFGSARTNGPEAAARTAAGLALTWVNTAPGRPDHDAKDVPHGTPDPNGDTMNTTSPTEWADCASLLQQMRSDLQSQLSQQRAGLGRADAAAQARSLLQGDGASAETQLDLTMALQEREAAELNDIDAALQRLSDGSYGACVDCGADIPRPRPLASPTALRCIACQSVQEKAQGIHTHSM
jgi:DnaK suppressor protein